MRQAFRISRRFLHMSQFFYVWVSCFAHVTEIANVLTVIADNSKTHGELRWWW